MKRVLILALAAGLLASASASAAVPAPGKFRGETAKGDPMGLRVAQQGELHDLFLAGVKLRCDDGYKFNTPTKKKKRIKAKFFAQIADDGSWNSTDDNWDPYGVYIDYGQFTPKGKKTTGQVEVKTTISKNHERKGGFGRAVHCTSGPLTFELKRES